MALFERRTCGPWPSLGHGSAGKTTLAEALLAKPGAIPAAGSVEKGTTVSDFDRLEKTFLHSLRTSVLHLDLPSRASTCSTRPAFPISSASRSARSTRSRPPRSSSMRRAASR